jgi:GNAT superfamily N-acetyltransferase
MSLDMLDSGVMAERIHVARLREEEIEAAAELVSRVFFEQLRAVSFETDEEQRRSYAEGFVRVVKFFYAHGEPLVGSISGKIAGVALWMAPHTMEFEEAEAAEFGLLEMGKIFAAPLGRLYELDRKFRDLRFKHLSGEPHWFLALLNIDPDRRGSGIAGELLRPILLRADEGNLPCYVETLLADTVPFYQRHGFRILVEGVEPTSGVPYWTLCREPQEAKVSDPT